MQNKISLDDKEWAPEAGRGVWPLPQAGVTESGHPSESSFQDWLEMNQ